MLHNGKEVLNVISFSFDKLKVGDYVEEEVVDDLMDLLPPAV